MDHSRIKALNARTFDPTWNTDQSAADYRADKAAELAAASLAVMAAVVEALIHAGVVDAANIRASLGNLVADLTPEERQQAYGHSLQLLLAGLGSSESDQGMAPSGATHRNN